MAGEHDASRLDVTSVDADGRRVRGGGERAGQNGVTDRHGDGGNRRGVGAGDGTEGSGGSSAAGADDPDRGRVPVRVAERVRRRS